MFGPWNNKPAVCEKRKRSSSVSSTDDELERVAKKALSNPKNSCGLHPSLARPHNGAEKTSKSPTLLSIPTNILAAICRHVVVVDEQIVVSADDLLQSSQPALLRVCRDIRKVARPIFYRENDFQFVVEDFDVVALLPFRDLCVAISQAPPVVDNDSRVTTGWQGNLSAFCEDDRYWKATKWQQGKIEWQAEGWALEVTASDESFAGVQSWSVSYTPDWANLVGWLELYHKDEIGGYEPDFDGGSEQAALASVFDLVKSYRGQSWEFMRTTLPHIRRLLSGADENWSY